MTEARISVIIPVGPNPAYRKYLPGCLESVRNQARQADEVLVIDDQAHLEQADVGDGVRLWKTPWLSGVAHAFNFGVALAEQELVFMLGSDDRLMPWCLGDCLKSYEQYQDSLGYYYVDVQYSDGRSQNLACNAAMVTKALWKHNGGFPVESAVGAPDTVLISIMLAAKGSAGNLRHVDSAQPPYWYRVHDQTDTAARAPRFQGAIFGVRGELTKSWRRPEWPR